jgi:surface polysaccharide O-acyltransferase-like enzyme
MISGALLLDKEEPYGLLLRKRFLRHLLVLICASANLYIYTATQMTHKEMSVSEFLKNMYSGKITVAYWFLFAYLGFILMLPLLRKLVRNMEDRDFKWILGICTAVSLLDYLQFYLFQGKVSYSSDFSVFVSQNYVLYPLMGYYMEKRMSEKDLNKKNFLILWGAAILSIAVTCYMSHYRCAVTNNWKESNCSFLSHLIFFPAMAVFFTARLWFTRHAPGPKLSKVISTLGGLTFGIYLIERICRMETQKIYFLLEPYIHPFPACFIWILCACLFGGVCIFVLKLIPGFKKWI